MNRVQLSFLLACIMYYVQSHIVPEEKQEKVKSDSIVRFPEILPPISIIDLRKSSRRVSRADAEKNKMAKYNIGQNEWCRSKAQLVPQETNPHMEILTENLKAMALGRKGGKKRKRKIVWKWRGF
ncbi:agouti-signaling protein-like isoform 2-T3 [Anomaloglossus baeobatrachus]|uniref:agouti-signaling protein-like isoform X2 n=1 Tax=Anomaloglossus baeobatrachus TaxID=238106 RepID=UPI003F5075E2